MVVTRRTRRSPTEESLVRYLCRPDAVPADSVKVLKASVTDNNRLTAIFHANLGKLIPEWRPTDTGLLELSRLPSIWILLELMMMEMVVTTAAVRRAKFHSNRHHQSTNTQPFTGRMPFLSPNQGSGH